MKSSTGRVSDKLARMARRYETALRKYLTQLSSDEPQSAVRIGREAVALGLETLDVALIHEKAVLNQDLPVAPAAARTKILKRAGMFFAAAIAPLEEGHRVAIESNGHLNRLNQELSQRTRDFATSNRKLKKEIDHRKLVEETLRKSEQKSGKLLAQSRILHEQTRRLSRRILSVQEEERKRISRELHDVVAQLLTGINVQLANLKRNATANTKGIESKISKTQRLVEKSVDVVHRFARELRPAVLDDLGLVPALHSFLKDFMKEKKIRASLTAAKGLERLSNSKSIVLYRVAQEALTNVSRHAKASRVDVFLERLPSSLIMRIQDNGQGFDVKKAVQAKKGRRLGLLGMRERVEMVGGTFEIESETGKGTVVLAKIPFRTVAKERVRK